VVSLLEAIPAAMAIESTRPPPGSSAAVSPAGAEGSKDELAEPSPPPGLTPPTTPAPAPPDSASLEPVLESLVKVTLASFGGSLVGLALQRQEDRNRRQPHQHRHSRGSAALDAARRSRPPAAAGSMLPRPPPPSSLPGQWALSCLLFATVVEAARHASPTSRLLRRLSPPAQQPAAGGEGALSSSPPDYRSAFLAPVGDSAAGGAAAGAAGGWALAARTPPPTSPAPAAAPSLLLARGWARAGWGLRVGAALGLAAGLVQAAADVAGLHLARQRDDRPAGAATQSPPPTLQGAGPSPPRKR
jgi:hypothetical protein